MELEGSLLCSLVPILSQMNPISLRSILILSSHLRPSHSSCLIPSVLPITWRSLPDTEMKVKVKLPLCLSTTQLWRTRQVQAKLRVFLISALNASDSLTLRPHFPEETEGPQMQSEHLGLAWKGTPVFQSIASHFTDW